MAVILVDPAVTYEKFERELQLWKDNSEHERRGWLLLKEDRSVPSVELAFLAGVATSAPTGFLPVIVCAVRLSYENYDLWPPSLTFIDAFSKKPARPHVRAFQSTPQGPRDVLIDGHPLTGLPFLCLPGIREYHTHPQHTGDDWLLHRPLKDGTLMNVCERIWRMMVRNVVGLHVAVQALPALPLQAQVVVQIVQGDVSVSQPPPKPESELRVPK